MADNRVVKAVAAGFGAVAYNHLAEGKHRDIAHTGADIHNHGAVGLIHGQARAQSGGQGAV